MTQTCHGHQVWESFPEIQLWQQLRRFWDFAARFGICGLALGVPAFSMDSEAFSEELQLAWAAPLLRDLQADAHEEMPSAWPSAETNLVRKGDLLYCEGRRPDFGSRRASVEVTFTQTFKLSQAHIESPLAARR